MKIICIGRNYARHARELNNPVPEEPVVFCKPESSLCRDGVPFIYPAFTNNLQYECEIVLRICKTGKHIEINAAAAYYDQWTVGIDFTARDLQQKLKDQRLPWELAKAFDQSAAIGRWVTFTAEERYASTFSLKQNGRELQSGTTADLLFSFEKLISFLSEYFTLETGDLIFTGTPEGVGPVQQNGALTGWLNGKQLLHLEIR